MKVSYKITENVRNCIFDEVGGLVMFKDLQKDTNEIEMDVSSLINCNYKII